MLKLCRKSGAPLLIALITLVALFCGLLAPTCKETTEFLRTKESSLVHHSEEALPPSLRSSREDSKAPFLLLFVVLLSCLGSLLPKETRIRAALQAFSVPHKRLEILSSRAHPPTKLL